MSWFFYVLTAMVVLSFTLTRKPVRLLGVSRQLSDSHAEIGQAVSVQVSLDWARPSGPGWMLVQDGLPPSFRSVRPCGRLFMSGQESLTAYSYQVSGTQRGYHRIGPLSISCGDLFGLDQVTASGEDADYLTIFPRIYPIPPLRIPSNRPIGEAPLNQAHL